MYFRTGCTRQLVGNRRYCCSLHWIQNLIFCAITRAAQKHPSIINCFSDFHALLMSDFERRVLRIEPTTCTKVCSRGLNLHRDKKNRIGERQEDPLWHTMLRIKGFAEHSRCTCVNRPSRSADEQFHNNAPQRKCLRETTTACVSLVVFFRIRRGTLLFTVQWWGRR